MTTLERKKYLKQKIDLVEDDAILDKIEKLIKENQGVYVFSEKQIMAVNEARTEYLQGEFTTDEEEQLEIEKWFEEQDKLFGQSSQR